MYGKIIFNCCNYCYEIFMGPASVWLASLVASHTCAVALCGGKVGEALL
jgi:hypothetical protein